MHKVSCPSVPGSGLVTTDTITVARSAGQGGSPVTVYVYVPDGCTEGSWTPANAPFGPDHVPPVSAVAPSSGNKGVFDYRPTVTQPGATVRR